MFSFSLGNLDLVICMEGGFLGIGDMHVCASNNT